MTLGDQPSDEQRSTHMVRVLLVDDYPPMRAMLRVMFEVTDAYVVVGEAATSAEAIGLARERHPDVIVFDLSVDQALPSVPTLRRAAPTARIIAYSAQPSSAAAKSAFDAGADDYVEKGPPRELLARIAALVPAPAAATDPDETAAVVAHGMLNTISVVQGAATMLRASWDELKNGHRDELLVMMRQQCDVVIDTMRLLPAVSTHKLLNHFAPVFGAVDVIEARPTDRVARDDALDTIVRAGHDAAVILADLMRGLSADAAALLDELGAAARDH